VWLIAGIYLLTATALARWSNPFWVGAIIVMGLISVNVSLTGFCIMANGLYWIGAEPRLGKACEAELGRSQESGIRGQGV
jgi:hypothetical protein